MTVRWHLGSWENVFPCVEVTPSNARCESMEAGIKRTSIQCSLVEGEKNVFELLGVS